MPFPTTVQGLLGNFPRGADPPANDPCVKIPLVQLPTYLSLRAISMPGAGGRSARGGAIGRRGMRKVGRREEGGEDESKVRRGGSNDASDAETEEEEWGHTLMTASL